MGYGQKLQEEKMKTTLYFILCIVSLVFLYNDFSFGQFVDNFEYYFPNQQVACQKPEYWTTRNLLPCDPVEDPYLSSDHAFSGQHSVKILPGNYLVKPVDLPIFYYYIWFEVYIPTGKSGYFNLMSVFSPDSIQTGLECYLDENGSGRLIHGDTVNFSWAPGTWQTASLSVDAMNGDSYFYFGENLISNWDWRQGGIIASQIQAAGFNGITSTNEMYVDDFVIYDGCLSCYPPDPPYNLTAEEIFNPNPAVKLNWQNSSMFILDFYIIRKEGYPNDPGNYQYIGATVPGTTEYIDSLVTINQRYSYGVVTFGYYGYSDTSNFVTILVEPTPVELISFSGTVSPDNDVVLNWQTATETNNKGFDVERSVRRTPFGEVGSRNSEAEGWERIGYVPGYGTTIEPKSYSFTDDLSLRENVISGDYKYRLKQIDFDGSFEYSKEIEVEVNASLQFSLSQNYPNPFNPITTIKYQLPVKGFVSLKIYNSLGQEIETLVNEEKPTGSFQVKFDGTRFPSGVYFYRIETDKFSNTKKFILLK